jgi:hypothetical protein
MKNLICDNMQVFFDGKPWIITRRQKTSVSYNVPLMDIPLKSLKNTKGWSKVANYYPYPAILLFN